MEPRTTNGQTTSGSGLAITRRFTRPGADPFASVQWSRRTSRIANPDGSVVFEMTDAEIPASWSQVAADIIVSKYFRKAGVPQSDADGHPLKDEGGNPVLGPERSAKQVISRLAGTWRHWGETNNYFASTEDAQTFEDELKHMLVHQMAAPNSPQWFNTGLNHAYGITGPAQGHWYVDPADGQAKQSVDSYSRPAPHACFIQSVNDDLVNEDGIMDLWVREARIFKYGSGTGTNFSKLRGEGEPLAGGGTSSGLMSFLKVGDRAAGAIKSGGTTRRAAKMVCLDLDHPDIETFITWKADEEKKVAALIAAGYPSDFNGDAYATVSGQNSNNSVRVPDAFVKALEADGDWHLRWRTDPSHVSKTVRARDLWQRIAEAAWQCADPGVQFDTTMNDWHTSPESGRINATNPCSEYCFLDNTACNLASLNLIKFLNVETGEFDVEGFRHAVRIWTVVLEISVLMAQFPSKEIARLSYDFRTLGLGYANLGTVLMLLGLPYDSTRARAYAGAVTALLTGESYAASAELAKHLGPFPGYLVNERHMLRVIRNHRRAAYHAPAAEYEQLSVIPMGIDPAQAPADLLRAARESWDRALAGGELYGYRNAQTTLLAPTGTIGLLMDCDTTGVEPDFALVKFKKLAGGGYFKIANQSIEPALQNLGYSPEERKEILTFVLGTLTLDGAPHVNRESLNAKGFTDEDIAKVEKTLPGVFELPFAFNVWTLGQEALDRVGISAEQASKPGFDLLTALGFSRVQIEEANERVCGTMTVEGAPHLKPEHLPVFDCANKCGKTGTRFIHHLGHITMMGATQPFLSGAISKTINMPNEATVADITDAYMQSWKHGVKAMALYRDGSKLSQPLSTKSETKERRGDGETGRREEGEAEVQERIAAAVAIAVVSARQEWEQEQAEREPQPLVASSVSVGVDTQQLSFVATPRPAPYRRRLPSKRRGFTQEARVAGNKIYMRTGEYEDGTLGEVFIDMHKEGAAFRSMINCFAISISKGLQYGVPLDEYVDTFTFTRFEPQGMVTGHPNIKFATSVIDYVFRVLGLEYLGRTDLVQVPPDERLDDEGTPGGGGSEVSASASFSAPALDTTPAITPAVPSPLDQTAHAAATTVVAATPAPTSANGSAYPNGHANGTNGPALSGANGITAAPPALGAMSVMAASGTPVSVLDAQLGELMGDAPFCDVCGHITVRNGACYKCLNCGNSLGCS